MIGVSETVQFFPAPAGFYQVDDISNPELSGLINANNHQRLNKWLPDQQLQLPSSVVTIGVFDGVHRGHQQLIGQAVRRAHRLQVPAVAYTFDPPPRTLFQQAAILTSLPDKLRRLAALGIDYTIVANFNQTYLKRTAAQFITELTQLNPTEIWVGSDFRFGQGRTGSVTTLAQHFNTQTIPTVCCRQGQVISSSRVRQLLSQKLFTEARCLLGWSR